MLKKKCNKISLNLLESLNQTSLQNFNSFLKKLTFNTSEWHPKIAS